MKVLFEWDGKFVNGSSYEDYLLDETAYGEAMVDMEDAFLPEAYDKDELILLDAYLAKMHGSTAPEPPVAELVVRFAQFPTDPDIAYLVSTGWRACDRLRLPDGFNGKYFFIRKYFPETGAWVIAEGYRKRGTLAANGYKAMPVVRVISNQGARLRDFFEKVFLGAPMHHAWKDARVLRDRRTQARGQDMGALLGIKMNMPEPHEFVAAEPEAFAVGDRVVVHGLVGKPKYNGHSGTVRARRNGKGRYPVAVDMRDGPETIALKVANLALDAGPARNASPDEPA